MGNFSLQFCPTLVCRLAHVIDFMPLGGGITLYPIAHGRYITSNGVKDVTLYNLKMDWAIMLLFRVHVKQCPAFDHYYFRENLIHSLEFQRNLNVLKNMCGHCNSRKCPGYMTRTFRTKHLIWSKLQYFATHQKPSIVSSILKSQENVFWITRIPKSY